MNIGVDLTLFLASAEGPSLLTTIAAAFAAAWVLGLVTQRIGLSPIIGYLMAGVVIGPYTPGFVGDVMLAQQLAEVGVILIMFGVGLHFRLSELWAVQRIAIPGAVGQSLVATLASVAIFHFLGWPIKTTLVLGMAMAVASTVVLLRVLSDRNLLTTTHGHVAVGWLIVEDIFTVLALVVVPMMAPAVDDAGATSGPSTLVAVGWAMLKLAVLVAIVLLAGSRIVPWILISVAKLRSSELFTLTVLVLSVTIAVGSYAVFGASVALGAFLAGMVVAQSPTSHQAAADALPMRDAFGVLFFVAVGMLLDPAFLVANPLLVAGGLLIVLVFKPLAAIVIVATMGYPARTALTVALGLAQIGEFSFILAQVASDHALMPPDGVHLLIATAIITITINPLLFRQIDRIENLARRSPRLWRLINGRADRHAAEVNAQAALAIEHGHDDVDGKAMAIIVGYGPVGRLVDAILRDAAFRTVIIDTNIDTVRMLARSGRVAVFGDATRRQVLEQAGVRNASNLVITMAEASGRGALVMEARALNPQIDVTVRARYLAERNALIEAGASHIIYEEGEAGIALARQVMQRRGVDQPMIEKLLAAVRRIWKMEV